MWARAGHHLNLISTGPFQGGEGKGGEGEKLEEGRGKERRREGAWAVPERVLRHQSGGSREQEGGGVLGAEVLVVFLGGRCPPLGDSVKGKEPQKAGKVGGLGLGPGGEGEAPGAAGPRPSLPRRVHAKGKGPWAAGRLRGEREETHLPSVYPEPREEPVSHRSASSRAYLLRRAFVTAAGTLLGSSRHGEGGRGRPFPADWRPVEQQGGRGWPAEPCLRRALGQWAAQHPPVRAAALCAQPRLCEPSHGASGRRGCLEPAGDLLLMICHV